jgi:cell division septation protein DedD
VLLASDAAEVARRTSTFADELGCIGDVGQALVQRAALHSVRMERGADQQVAALTHHVRKVEAEFVAPEGVSDEDAALLKAEAVRAAMFDPSKEAKLARQYELASERGFYRALKQLRQMELQSEALLKADDEQQRQAVLASFLNGMKANQAIDADLDAMEAKYGMSRPQTPANPAPFTQAPARIDVPIRIGKSR